MFGTRLFALIYQFCRRFWAAKRSGTNGPASEQEAAGAPPPTRGANATDIERLQAWLDAPIVPKKGLPGRLLCQHDFRTLGRGLWDVCRNCGRTRPPTRRNLRPLGRITSR